MGRGKRKATKNRGRGAGGGSHKRRKITREQRDFKVCREAESVIRLIQQGGMFLWDESICPTIRV